MIIRQEQAGDIEKIKRLTEKAFPPMSFSNGTDSAIIEALREQGQLTLSLVADDRGEIVGQVTFSPVTIDGEHDGWFGLGPVSVLPERQGQQIGSQLINCGLDFLKRKGAKRCVLTGDPNYYSRFGFINKTEFAYGNLDKTYVQQLAFVGPIRNGRLEFCRALEEVDRS